MVSTSSLTPVAAIALELLISRVRSRIHTRRSNSSILWKSTPSWITRSCRRCSIQRMDELLTSLMWSERRTREIAIQGDSRAPA